MSQAYTFVSVHGGGHDGSAWRQVVEHAAQLGHTAYPPTLAGHGNNAFKNVTYAEETRSVSTWIASSHEAIFARPIGVADKSSRPGATGRPDRHPSTPES